MKRATKCRYLKIFMKRFNLISSGVHKLRRSWDWEANLSKKNCKTKVPLDDIFIHVQVFFSYFSVIIIFEDLFIKCSCTCCFFLIFFSCNLYCKRKKYTYFGNDLCMQLSEIDFPVNRKNLGLNWMLNMWKLHCIISDKSKDRFALLKRGAKIITWRHALFFSWHSVL